MDPVSILSVATSVVTFVDFSSKIVSRCREIHRTGKSAPDDVVSLAASAEDLSKISANARDKINNLLAHHPHHAESLERLTSECVIVEKELTNKVAKFKVAPQGLNKYKSTFVVAVRSSWLKAEFDDREKQLGRIREQITLTVLTCIWEDTTSARVHAAKSNEVTDNIIDSLSRIEANLAAIKQGTTPTGGKALSAPLLEAVWPATSLVNYSDDNAKLRSPPSVPSVPDTQASHNISNKIIESLGFEEIADRAKRIAVAFPNTFQWLFQNSENNVDQSMAGDTSRFPQWLSSQDPSIFWITGVPASGKSTLMKFMSEHHLLKEGLHKWAGDCELLVATFYFWGPGSVMQRSRTGLLKTLLHQLLGQKPELAGFLAPRRRMFFELMLSDEKVAPPPWEWDELCTCLFRLVSNAGSKNLRVALFIDGLDEYDGNTRELTAFLTDLHQRFDLKLCVSSRPWNVFADAFRQSPSLSMHKLTKPDIDIYVEQKLGRNPAIEDLRAVMPLEIDHLIGEIGDKAKGVFLWVVLVVEQLLLTSQENPQFASIRETFDALPDELNALYTKILDQIGPDKQRVASHLYQIVMEWKRIWSGQIPATYLWLAVEITDPTKSYSYPEPEKEPDILRLVDRLLQGNTRGILQVSKDEEGHDAVDFLHRTAFEWLRMDTNWSAIRERGGADYHPIFYILRVLVSQLNDHKTFDVWERNFFHSRIFVLATRIPDSVDGRAKLVRIIDDLDLNRDPYQIIINSKISGSNELNSMSLAAARACHTYIHGRLESQSRLKAKKKGIMNLFSQTYSSLLRSALDCFVFALIQQNPYLSFRTGVRDRASGVRDRVIDIWETASRLDTMHFFFQNGVKLNNKNRRMLEKNKDRFDQEDERKQFVTLLLKVYSDGNNLRSFEKHKAEFFPSN